MICQMYMYGVKKKKRINIRFLRHTYTFDKLVIILFYKKRISGILKVMVA